MPLRPLTHRLPATCNIPLICIGLFALVILVFGQTLGFQFVNFDDDHLVSENAHILRGLTSGNLSWALVAGTGRCMADTDYWRPLSLISHMADMQLFGMHAGAHHCVNVTIHAINSVLLFLVLFSMTDMIWRSAMVAALFAIHPLHVESVAWVAERKDVLSGLFFVLTLAAYVRFVRIPFAWGNYFLILIFSALALMSKPMVVTIPVVLLVLDYWPLNSNLNSNVRRRPLYRLVLEKVPLFAMALCVAWLTAHSSGGINPELMDSISLPWRLGMALVSSVTYLNQMVWPFGLAVFYPHPGTSLPLLSVCLASVVLVVITLTVIWKHKHRYLAFGWLWYLVMLLPVAGIVQSGEQAHADRYTYLPLIGIFIMIVWALADWAGDFDNRKKLMAAATVIILGSFVLIARQQTSYWHDSITLMSHTVQCTGNNTHAHDNLGNAYLKNGNFNEALKEYQTSLKLRPGYAYAEYNLACALLKKGLLDEAITHYRKALEINPDFENAHNNLGEALRLKGEYVQALAHLHRALELKPDDAEAENNLANTLFQQGSLDLALPHYQRAVLINPSMPEAHNIIGSVTLMKGDQKTALSEFQIASMLKPENFNYSNNVAWLLATSPDKSLRNGDQALKIATQAVKLSRGNAALLRTLAAAYASTGRFADALQTAKSAMSLATFQGNRWLMENLQNEIALYESGKAIGE